MIIPLLINFKTEFCNIIYAADEEYLVIRVICSWSTWPIASQILSESLIKVLSKKYPSLKIRGEHVETPTKSRTMSISCWEGLIYCNPRYEQADKDIHGPLNTPYFLCPKSHILRSC